MPKRIITRIANADRALVILSIVGLLSYIVLLIVWMDTRNDTNQLAREALALAESNEQLIQGAKELASNVQEQRRNAIRTQCQEQNERHRELEEFVREQGQENPIVFQFIDKLAPLQDCDALVRELTNGG